MPPSGHSRVLGADLYPFQLCLFVFVKAFNVLPLCLQRIIMVYFLLLDLKTFGPITIGMQRGGGR